MTECQNDRIQNESRFCLSDRPDAGIVPDADGGAEEGHAGAVPRGRAGGQALRHRRHTRRHRSGELHQ